MFTSHCRYQVAPGSLEIKLGLEVAGTNFKQGASHPFSLSLSDWLK
jgi:hypothetical protein